MYLKIFLDDIRMPDKWYEDGTENVVSICRTSQEFKEVINKHGADITKLHIDFDNDLGMESEVDGYDCAKWYCYHWQELTPKLKLNDFSYGVHSANPIARENIHAFMEVFFDFYKDDK